MIPVRFTWTQGFSGPDRTLVTVCLPGANLLAALAAGELPCDYNCTRGTCGRCRVQVLAGREHLSVPSEREWDLLERSGLDEGLRLACQTRVNGPCHVRQ